MTGCFGLAPAEEEMQEKKVSLHAFRDRAAFSIRTVSTNENTWQHYLQHPH